jgi:hypothetical protein
VKAFLVIVRTASGIQEPQTCIASSSAEAALQTADLYDEPCGITVRERAC